MESQNTEAPAGVPRVSLVAWLGFGCQVLLQVAWMAWWASGVSVELRHLTDAVVDVRTVQYTKNEARGDLRNVELQVLEIARRVNSLEERKGSR